MSNMQVPEKILKPQIESSHDVVFAPISTEQSGLEMHELMRKLWPICRSISGQGVRDSLAIMAQELPELKFHEIASGTQCFDWKVPDEWNIRDAYIVTPGGTKICEFKKNNLHVMGYSVPVNAELELEDLLSHLYSLPEIPHAIPYVTSYYKKRWGLCISQTERDGLKPGRYRAVIDSTLEPGVLNYADLVLPGESKEEVLLSTYICHPSMANNELSGPTVAIALAKWLTAIPQRRYTYRFVFIPETIGSIIYLSHNMEHLKQHTVAGFMINCVGDDRAYGFMPSRQGNSLADRAGQHALKHHAVNFDSYSFLLRGSDERQYCSPGVDLPIASLFRSKYGTYPEYHTSLDDMTLVTPGGLLGGLNSFQRAIQSIEANHLYLAQVKGEPNLGSRGLYPTISTTDTHNIVLGLINVFSYSDGLHDLLAIAELLDMPIWELAKAANSLNSHGLIGLSK
jgi:aminopeptidase-like protein